MLHIITQTRMNLFIIYDVNLFKYSLKHLLLLFYNTALQSIVIEYLRLYLALGKTLTTNVYLCPRRNQPGSESE